MQNEIHSYKELVVWQKSMQLVTEIYQLTKLFPKEEMFGLTSQMRRASVSIPANIAEGRRRGTRKDFTQFLRIAFGSGAELETYLEMLKSLSFSKNLNTERSFSLLSESMRMLNVMIRKLQATS